MATLQRKKVNGNYYWYIVESRRVNGKPRPIVLAYLGKAEDLLSRLSGEGPIEIRSESHGGVQVLLELAQSLNVAEVINRHVTTSSKIKRVPVRDGLTVGESLVLAAIGRACKPTSKMGWYEWCRDTSLEYLLKKNLKGLTSQHFWDQMHMVPVGAIEAIERDIVKALSDTYPLDCENLFFDTTNFFTFIDSGNTHCDMPKRGHNKQKRNDLRQVSLALLVTGKDHIPLFSHLYDGNKNDITAFKESMPKALARVRALSLDEKALTLVFDKGNNSKANFEFLDNQGVHFVGSLSPSHFNSLIETANTCFETLVVSNKNISAAKILHPVWGKTRTCVVFISEELFSGQVHGIYQSLDKKTKQLQKLQERLQNTKSRYTTERIQEIVNVIVDCQYIKNILKVEVVQKEKNISLRYWVDLVEWSRLKDKVLGRQILTTSREEWSVEEIISCYQRKTKIEYAFRCLKDRDHLSLRPQYHWTDQKISVHALICVIALLLATTAYAKARKEAHYDKDLSSFLDDLGRIRLASIIQRSHSDRGRSKITKKLELPTKNLKNLVNTFRIHA